MSDNRMGTDLLAFMSIDENRVDYIGWLKSKQTQRYLNMTEQSLRPVLKPADMTPDRYSGVMDGRFEALRVLTNLDKIYRLVEAAKKSDDIEETFGVTDTLLTTWGITESQYKAAIAAQQQQKEQV